MSTRHTALLALLPLLACEGGDDDETKGDGNGIPVAFAGPDQVVSSDAPVQLDGRGSYDPDGDDFILHWVLQRAPEGSNAEDTAFPYNHTAARETVLRPDLPGTYVVELWVEDSRGGISEPDLLTITVTAGEAPIADARGPEDALTGDVLTLDGTWSYDPKGHDLTYSWMVASAPANSDLDVLLDAEQPTVTAEVDVPGLYAFALTVHNGFTASLPDVIYVNVEPLNPEPPIADVGDGVLNGQDCTTIELDGSDSYDPNGAALDYYWEFLETPANSSVTTSSLDDTRSPTPSFFPDVAGTYVASLTVYDGSEWSWPTTLEIEASERAYNTTPKATVGETIRVDLGDAVCTSTAAGYDCDPCAAKLVNLSDGASVYDADGDELSILWEPFTGEDVNIVSADSLDADILFDNEKPRRPGACEQNLYHVWLTATDCPGAEGSDLLSVWATCCGVAK